MKYEHNKLDFEILKDNIEYIFNTTLDIILSIHLSKELIKTASSRKYYLDLNSEEVPIFNKADATSEVLGTTPKGMTRLNTDYKVTGLQGNGPYWHVSHLEDEQFINGFIHDDYVKKDG